ncbi:MAG: DNA mismatch repair endonuclease MutL [Verrucomicrobiaceae bacterium]|nr:DNA mismatch repair endonuclease MutL [Verrucomicrobiaceae bacterium]
MSKIRIMPDSLASQVAAGEVVERPAAVVRELVENSLDAGASAIEVAVQRGGSSLIRITDNGSGMDREDALLCIERHATSKIRTKEDLASISTFGFRGEALPSIASVSRFRMLTREKDAISGTEIEIHGGRLAAVRDGGGPHGTMIEARSLFFNVPARRKFLRSENTEYAHVEQQFRLHAIANPHVAFTLIKDDEPVFHLPATHDIRDRIRGLVGPDLAGQLLEVGPVERHGIEISGYIGGPSFSRSNKSLQVTFLNGRPVESQTLHYALREGYHNALMKGQYPVTFLFVRMDPHDFDINVHPAKKEVRFHNSQPVREAVSLAVHDTLHHSRVLPIGHATPSRQPTPLLPSDSEAPLPLPEVPRVETPLVTPVSTKALNNPQHDDSPPPPLAPISKIPSTATSKDEKVPETFRILGVLNNLYVLMEGKDGLVLMDQHAAHERVLFEKMRRAMESEGVPSQRLLMPVMLQLSPRDHDLLVNNLGQLSKLGIEAEPFGANTLKIDTLPAFLKTDDPHRLLGQLVDEISALNSRSSSLRLGEDMIATTVCRHAVKANDHLRVPELESLVADLMACEMPYCCPHGRPTLIQISYLELERKFGRRAP